MHADHQLHISIIISYGLQDSIACLVSNHAHPCIDEPHLLVCNENLFQKARCHLYGAFRVSFYAHISSSIQLTRSHHHSQELGCHFARYVLQSRDCRITCFSSNVFVHIIEPESREGSLSIARLLYSGSHILRVLYCPLRRLHSASLDSFYKMSEYCADARI